MTVSAEYESVKSVTRYLNLYFSAIILPFGILFNGLSSFIFNRHKLNRTTMGFLYGNLTIIDSVSLLVGIVFIQFLPSVGVNLMNQSDYVCKFGQFFLRVVQQISSWIHVLISLDRYINVCFPNQFKWMRRRRTLTMIIAAIVLLVMILNVENLFFYVHHYEAKNGTNQTDLKPECTADPAIIFATDLMTACLRTWVPFAFMAFFSWRTIRGLWLSKKKLIRNESLKRERQFSLTVMSLNILFFSMNAPLSISLILTNINQYFESLSSDEGLIALTLFQSIAYSFSYLYQSITFFINLCLNKIFRQEVHYLLQKLKVTMKISNDSCESDPKVALNTITHGNKTKC